MPDSVNSFCYMQSDEYAFAVGDSAPTTPAVNMPDGFQEDEIDKTDPAYEAWVKEMTEKGEYGCMQPIQKWCPLPGDPRLNLKLKPSIDHDHRIIGRPDSFKFNQNWSRARHVLTRTRAHAITC